MNKLLVLMFLIISVNTTYGQVSNLYDAFQNLRDDFPYRDLADITTLGHLETLGNDCLLKKSDKETIRVPVLSDSISKRILHESNLFKGHGHLFSFNQYNDSLILIILAVPGHYATPSALLLAINDKGNIVDEIKVCSAFFDAGQGDLVRSRIVNDNLIVVHKNLDERPENVLCTAEISKYTITASGKINLVNTWSEHIECNE